MTKSGKRKPRSPFGGKPRLHTTFSDLEITHMVAVTPGWWARFVNGEDEESAVAPVACWVVAVDGDLTQTVRGITPLDDKDYPMTDPIDQGVRYFYDPEYRGDAGVSDPGPLG